MKLRITQKRSTIGRNQTQKRTMRALGIKRMRGTVLKEDTPQIRGMISKVSHLVEVLEVKG